MPARGLAERVYCTLRARYGEWSPDFLRIVERAYRGRIPPRFLVLVSRLERSRPWELPEEPARDAPRVVCVYPDGSEREL